MYLIYVTIRGAAACANEVVSSEREELILVDDQDREIGFQSKADCHDRDGLLHRAFSLFVFNREGEVLLQRRAANKRLWPLYWSNSCCSHPRRGEEMEEAVHRRLYQELRIRSELEFSVQVSVCRQLRRCRQRAGAVLGVRGHSVKTRCAPTLRRSANGGMSARYSSTMNCSDGRNVLRPGSSWSGHGCRHCSSDGRGRPARPDASGKSPGKTTPRRTFMSACGAASAAVPDS